METVDHTVYIPKMPNWIKKDNPYYATSNCFVCTIPWMVRLVMNVVLPPTAFEVQCTCNKCHSHLSQVYSHKVCSSGVSPNYTLVIGYDQVFIYVPDRIRFTAPTYSLLLCCRECSLHASTAKQYSRHVT